MAANPSKVKKSTTPGVLFMSLVVCEDIRTEIANKFTFVGVFPASTVVFENIDVQPTDENPIVTRLCFWVQFKRDSGGTATVSITGPQGKKHMDHSGFQIDGGPGDKYASLIITGNGSPFPVFAFGEYELMVEYNGKIGKRDFIITSKETG